VREQLRALSEASVVIGPHGAGLTNVLFSVRMCAWWRSSHPPATGRASRVITEAMGGSYAAYVAATPRHRPSWPASGEGNEDFSSTSPPCPLHPEPVGVVT
jgi:capsular polysaccharide biosynthesis protein